MADRDSAPLLVVIRRSPYGDSLARAALDTALAAAAFEQPLSVLFLGDGVLHLAASQDGRQIGLRDSGRLLASFPLYGIESVHADAGAAASYGIDLGSSPVPATAVDAPAAREMMSSARHILAF